MFTCIHLPATVAFRNVHVFMTRGRFPAELLVDKIHTKTTARSIIIEAPDNSPLVVPGAYSVIPRAKNRTEVI